MAKDGTCRGGARVGAGAKKKPLADKISAGNPGGRKLTVMEFTDAPALEGYEMNPIREIALFIYESTLKSLYAKIAHLIINELQCGNS